MKVLLLVGVSVVLSGCYLLVDARVKESAAIDYAVVKTTLGEIDAGKLDGEAAVEVLKRLERSMYYRVSYFEGRKPETEDPESGDSARGEARESR